MSVAADGATTVRVKSEGEPVDMAAYLAERRRALLQEVRAIEKVLGIEPTVQAVCPTCKARWAKKAG